MKRFFLSFFLLFLFFSPSLFSQRDWGQSGSIRLRWSDATTEFQDSLRKIVGDSVKIIVGDSISVLGVDNVTTAIVSSKFVVDTTGNWMLVNIDSLLMGRSSSTIFVDERGIYNIVKNRPYVNLKDVADSMGLGPLDDWTPDLDRDWETKNQC